MEKNQSPLSKKEAILVAARVLTVVVVGLQSELEAAQCVEAVDAFDDVIGILENAILSLSKLNKHVSE